MIRKSKNLDSVITLLKQAQLPLSAEEIFFKLKNKNEKLALSTVYRIINKLIDANIIRESVNNGNTARYEYGVHSHKHYLVCSKCNNMVPIDTCPISKMEDDIASKTGFNITGHKFELYGICPECIASGK